MATTTEFQSKTGGLVPAKATLPMAANELIHKGCMVCADENDRAIEAAYDEGHAVIGWAPALYDNRTTAPEGGGAAAFNADIDCGVKAFAFNGTAPKHGEVVFVYDNCTVSTDSHSGACGIAGYCVTTVGTECYVLVGPTVAGQIVIASSEASQLDTAQADIDALQADALTAQAQISIPIASWRASTGAAVAAFADGSVDGFELTDSEALGVRWNPAGGTRITLVTSVAMPQDLDDAAAVVFHALAFRVGSADTTTVLTLGAFFQTVGAAHTADADCGGNTGALDAATTVVGEYTRTLAAGDVPAAPCNLTLTLAPSAALDADDCILLATWLEYTRKLLTA